MDRFFYPTLDDGMTVRLADEEFHHLVHVLREKPGSTWNSLTAGSVGRSGRRAAFETGMRNCRLSSAPAGSAPGVALVLGVACPKGDRLKWLVEKATEMGVSELIPLQCERSVVEPRETKLARLEQTVLAACKQCEETH